MVVANSPTGVLNGRHAAYFPPFQNWEPLFSLAHSKTGKKKTFLAFPMHLKIRKRGGGGESGKEKDRVSGGDHKVVTED